MNIILYFVCRQILWLYALTYSLEASLPYQIIALFFLCLFVFPYVLIFVVWSYIMNFFASMAFLSKQLMFAYCSYTYFLS